MFELTKTKKPEQPVYAGLPQLMAHSSIAYGLSAITSISTNASLGKRATSTALLAG